MDLFGEAVFAYSQGEKSPFYLVDKNGSKDELDLSKYFRKYSELSELEKKLISEANGKVLDVGCGTGIFLKFFEKESIGIDISPHMIEIARNNGATNSLTVDFFDFQSKDQFDTITFIENNIGMAETVERTKRLLLKAKSLLKDSGKMLSNAPKVDLDYFSYEIHPEWKGKKGETFCWISFGFNYFERLCKDIGLNAEIIDSDDRYNLIKIRKLQ